MKHKSALLFLFLMMIPWSHEAYCIQIAPYHTNRGSNAVKSKKPINGQKALDNSVPYNARHRIAVCEGEFVVLMQTRPDLYHGHVRMYNQLRYEMAKALEAAGFINDKGKILIK